MNTDFEVVKKIHEITNIPYQAIAKISGIKWSKFHSFKKSGYLPEKQALKVKLLLNEYFFKIPENISTRPSPIKNINHKGEIFRTNAPRIKTMPSRERRVDKLNINDKQLENLLAKIT
jgi:hypothetical protein